MTEQEQNVAVAELQGWQVFSIRNANFRLPNGDWECGVTVPDYLHDLSAIHAAVLTLSRENLHQDPFIWSERDEYLYHLELIVFRDVEKAEGKPRQEIQFELVNATAAQCCEAYLRTKGRWKE